jgi:hypothetical protein
VTLLPQEAKVFIVGEEPLGARWTTLRSSCTVTGRGARAEDLLVDERPCDGEA